MEAGAKENQYRDGILFRNGLKILLQAFPEGVWFDVLSMDSERPELGPEVSETTIILTEPSRVCPATPPSYTAIEPSTRRRDSTLFARDLTDSSIPIEGITETLF